MTKADIVKALSAFGDIQQYGSCWVFTIVNFGFVWIYEPNLNHDLWFTLVDEFRGGGVEWGGVPMNHASFEDMLGYLSTLVVMES